MGSLSADAQAMLPAAGMLYAEKMMPAMASAEQRSMSATALFAVKC